MYDEKASIANPTSSYPPCHASMAWGPTISICEMSVWCWEALWLAATWMDTCALVWHNSVSNTMQGSGLTQFSVRWQRSDTIQCQTLCKALVRDNSVSDIMQGSDLTQFSVRHYARQCSDTIQCQTLCKTGVRHNSVSDTMQGSDLRQFSVRQYAKQWSYTIQCQALCKEVVWHN